VSPQAHEDRRPVIQMSSENRTPGTAIPILMYHKVGAPVHAKPDRFLNVSINDFCCQMRILSRLGYRGVTFAAAIEGLLGTAALPKKPVCVTFDDGYSNVAECAAPILDTHQWPATVFVPTAYVGTANNWEGGTGHPIIPIMDWARLEKLSSNGWEMAGHTHSHPRLAELQDPDAVAEIVKGKQELDARFNRPTSTFCYPYGSVGKRTPEMVRAAGFIGACTTRSGLARSGTDMFLLPRVKVAYSDGLAGFLYRLLIRPVLP
jgi:peptidoglycan/xylan/chitin deacetylase (PgdA/CDA1 family)